MRVASELSLAPFRCLSVAIALSAWLVGWAPVPAQAQPTESPVAYRVTFQGTWTTAATPGGLPGSAHFSPLIGATHNDRVTFWQVGGMASAGIEDVAELGQTGTFESEINASDHVGATIEKSIRSGGTVLPVDSEHNAIFQVFDFERPERVEKIVLTASGGPFRTRALDAMASATPAEAVAHPTWSMGDKISVDSATMMNKGLETIEAYHLFPIDARRIEVLVHPQSVVHGLVAYCDGSTLAQFGPPDMRTPIACCLAWPDRLPVALPRLDLAAIGRLTFEAPDPARFPALRLAREALACGGGAATALNAANEIAVRGFLRGDIGFLDIVPVVERTIANVSNGPIASLDRAIESDRHAREVARGLVAAARSGPGRAPRRRMER